MIPHGPKAISKSRQIALPAELMKRVGLEVGDQVYLAPHEQMSEAIVVLPIELVARWIDAGKSAARLDRRATEVAGEGKA